MTVQRGLTTGALVAAFAAYSATAADAQTDDLLSVQASPSVSSAPATVDLLIRLDRDDANRALTVEVDSLNLFRSSLIQLDGENAAAVHRVHLTSLPAGHYEVRVTLRLRDEEPTETARSSFTVSQ